MLLLEPTRPRRSMSRSLGTPGRPGPCRPSCCRRTRRRPSPDASRAPLASVRSLPSLVPPRLPFVPTVPASDRVGCRGTGLAGRGAIVTESSGRVLPELDENNEFFWKSGGDGKLRFQRCTRCGELRHPPSPVSSYCRSTEWEPAEVSGRGVIAGFTRNEQMWQPTFPPPYVIAIVAIDED